MKRIFIVLLLIGFFSDSYSQALSRTFDSKTVLYILIISRDAQGFIKAELDQSDGTKISTISFSPFTYDQFRNWLATQLKTKAGIAVGTADAEIDSKVMGFFYESVAHLMDTDDNDGPVAGTLTVFPIVPVSTTDQVNENKKSRGTIASKPFKVKSVQLEILEGFLENITVIVEDSSTSVNPAAAPPAVAPVPASAIVPVPAPAAAPLVISGKHIVFSNVFGIGFASKTNMSNLYNYWLIEKNKPIDQALRMNLGDLLQFDVHHEPGRRDYSPADGRYAYLITDSPVNAELRKDPLKRLIEARIYSDFVGLNQENPNGLIQTEIFKRINMNTNRSLAFQGGNCSSKILRFILGQGVGMLQFVTPTVTLSKFEENNRRLLVNRSQDTIALINQHQSFTEIINGKPVLRDSVTQVASLVGRPAITALDLLRYQNFSAGLDLNLLYAENIGGKFNFYLDAGIRFGRTALRDSANKVISTESATGLSKNDLKKTGFATDFGVNTFQIYPEFKIQWLPEERFGVTLSRRWTYMSLRNGDYAQGDLRLGSYDYKSSNLPLAPEKTKNWIGTWEILAFLKSGENGKLFFRYRLSNEIGNQSYNFHQAQVGYSFSILGNRQTKTNTTKAE